jgi:hypothetical protein
MRRHIVWFIVGATVVGVSAFAWEQLRYEGYGDIPTVILILFAPGYFIPKFFALIGAPLGYIYGAILNGAIYAAISWGLSKVPPKRKWIRSAIVILPFTPSWAMFFYAEFLAH